MSDEALGRIGLSILITMVVYGAFPFLFAFYRKHPIRKNRYRLYCIIATIIECLAFSAVMVALGGNVSSGAPAVVWGFIFYRSGLYTLRSHQLLIEEETQEVNNDRVEKVVPKDSDVDDKSLTDDESTIKAASSSPEKQWIYDQAANGMMVRIPADKYDNWRKVQDEKLAESETVVAQEVVPQTTESENEQPQNDDDNRMIYAEAWNGMTVRIPLKNYDTWKVAQDRIRAEHEADALKEKGHQELPSIIPDDATVDNKDQEQKPRVRFCRKCGTALVDESIYCFKCGTKVWLED